ncbi:MAG: lipase family protein, partial [Actinomycetota bacterium]|nr:lipase family protein [Actinomycetota bacterium]
LLFAEISMISYLPDAQAQVAATSIGFPDAVYTERDGAQAFVFMNEADRVVACRGTEPNEWNDIKADANALTDLAETIGRVHRGFKREADDIWPGIEELLREPDERALWFTGHSLGGAMTQILAGRCRLADIPAWPLEVYTYGSPRVGNNRYVAYNNVAHVRWVNNNDVVTKVPPTWLRYRHRGERMYLDHEGRIRRRLSRRQRLRDQWAGFKKGLKQRKIDHFSDHAIAAYVEHLARAVDEAF